MKFASIGQFLGIAAGFLGFQFKDQVAERLMIPSADQQDVLDQINAELPEGKKLDLEQFQAVDKGIIGYVEGRIMGAVVQHIVPKEAGVKDNPLMEKGVPETPPDVLDLTKTK